MSTYPDAECALRDVTLHVSDSQRSLAFYRDLLGFALLEEHKTVDQPDSVTLILDAGNSHRLRLESFTTPPRASTWLRNDLQPGYRHLGFFVQSVDATTARLKAAGVPFTLDPLDATGGVRIAFFTDPDGILLEVLEGTLEYHEVGTAAAPTRSDQPQAQGQGELVFDHIAITVADLHQSLHFYQEELGFEMIGQLIFNDARGFTITYLNAGMGVLELFSFSVPTLSRPAPASGPTIGIERIGFLVDDISDLDAQIRVLGLSEITPPGEPAGIEDRAGHRLLTDPEGNLIEFTERGYA